MYVRQRVAAQSFYVVGSVFESVTLTIDGITRFQETANMTPPKVVSRAKGKGWQVWRKVVSRST